MAVALFTETPGNWKDGRISSRHSAVGVFSHYATYVNGFSACISIAQAFNLAKPLGMDEI